MRNTIHIDNLDRRTYRILSMRNEIPDVDIDFIKQTISVDYIDNSDETFKEALIEGICKAALEDILKADKNSTIFTGVELCVYLRDNFKEQIKGYSKMYVDLSYNEYDYTIEDGEITYDIT